MKSPGLQVESNIVAHDHGSQEQGDQREVGFKHKANPLCFVLPGEDKDSYHTAVLGLSYEAGRPGSRSR